VTDLSHDGAADDGFHEIQLSGKQLVFLFMATTVVSVVIFLCGVLVGRGVRGETVSAADPLIASTAPATQTPIATSTASSPGEQAAPTSDADLTYQKRLDGSKPVNEVLKPIAEAKPAAEPVDSAPSAPPSPAPAAAPLAAAPAQAAKARAGTWAVQVVALTDRAAANAVVQRLSGKGYPAFLVVPQAGAPVQNYKVQVGRYADRAEAEQIKNRLKKEEQFEPWILR
jgi:cell division septation protein DedD